MSIELDRIGWEDEPSTKTPIDSGNLKKMEENTQKAITELETNLKETILYEAVSEKGTTEEITLSDNAENYEETEIFWNINQQYNASTKVTKPNNKNVVLSMLTVAGSNIRTWTQTNTIKENKITRGTTNYQDMNGALGTADFIYIDKVVGYNKKN